MTTFAAPDDSLVELEGDGSGGGTGGGEEDD